MDSGGGGSQGVRGWPRSEGAAGGAEQAAPGEEDPEALYEGAPILEGGDEEEWEQWVD